MSGLTKPDAEEFSQSLEQIGEGWFRQLALGIKLRAPEALGLTRREWSDRIGLKVRDRAERVNIETELSAEGLSNRAIADVLGVAEGTVRNDMAAQNCAPDDVEHEAGAGDAAQNYAVKDARAFRKIGGPLAPTIPDATSGTPRPSISSWCGASLERSTSTRLHIHSPSRRYRLRNFSLKRMTGCPSLGLAGYFVTRHIRRV